MNYIAYLCYPHPFNDDEEDREPVIKFEKPERWKYDNVITIQFSPLNSWPPKDKDL